MSRASPCGAWPVGDARCEPGGPASVRRREHAAEEERRESEVRRPVPAHSLVVAGPRRDLPHGEDALGECEPRLRADGECPVRPGEEEDLLEGAGVLWIEDVDRR